jgi:type I restriction enzyme R subunit
MISRLNSLFGEATPLKDRALFVNQVVSITRENEVVMAQVKSDNTREQVLKGNLPGAVQGAVVRALTSHQSLATLLLKSDKQSMSALTDIVYDLLNRGDLIDLEEIGV